MNRLPIGKIFLLDDLTHGGESWVEFLNEVFHHTVRITTSMITDAEPAP